MSYPNITTQPANGHKSRAEIALELAAAGLPVFPVKTNKKPLTQNGFKDATTDPETVRELWAGRLNAWVGIPTGAASGYVVLDADTPEAEEFMSGRGHEPDVRTGRGAHFYFQHPNVPVPNSAGKIMPGLDVRGDGGYTVVCGDDRAGTPPVDPPDFPKWVAAALVDAERQTATNGHRDALDIDAILEGVPEGSRDTEIFKYASSLRGRGMPKGEAIVLVKTAAGNAVPPFPEDVALEKVHRAYEKYPEGRSGDDKPGHDELRNRFINSYPNIAYGQNEWKMYDAGTWSPAPEETILEGVGGVLEDAKPEGVKLSNPIRTSIMQLVRTRVFVGPHQWDADPDLLVCQNGTLHIPGRELRDHSPDHHITSGVPYAYDPGRRANAWAAYLDSTLDAETTAFLQEFAGYALTTDTRHELALWLYGPPGTGKSTFLSGLMAMLGEGRYGTLSLSEMDRNRFALGSRVPGKTLLVAAETPGGYFRSTDQLNSLISGEPVDAERKYMDPTTIIPHAKIAWAMNDLPRVADPHNGVFRRVKVVKFPPLQGAPEPDLKSFIQKEGAGILNWALDGLDRLRERGGFKIPTSVADATDEFQRSNDVVGEFLDVRCVQEAGAYTTPSTLYCTYTMWCEANGHKPKSSTQFKADLEKRGFVQKRTKKARSWVDIRPTDAGDA